MNSIEFKNYGTSYGDFSLKNINIAIEDNETFAILGKTGSGKSMLLNSLLGMHQKSTGHIYLNGHDIDSFSLQNRKIGIVYQDYRLFPCMNVYENIVFGMTVRKYSQKEKEKRAAYLMELFGISNIKNQPVHTISGGEAQRTALARALCIRPDILLLDEPFCALDPSTKHLMYKELKVIQQEFKCTILFVTHDFIEAKTLADRIGILLHGELKTIVASEQLFSTNYENHEISSFLEVS